MVPRRGRVPRLPGRRPAAISLAVPASTANGQPAFGTYLWDDAAGAFVPGGLDVLTLQDGRVAAIVAFLTADLIRFGLPCIRP